MKSFTFIILLLTTGCACIAQDYTYRPFVEEGKTWHMEYNNEEIPEYPSYAFYYYIQGDTIIGDVECKKFYVFNQNNSNETRYIMSVYESDKKVFFIPNNTEESYILYDFAIPCNGSASVSFAIHPEWIINMKSKGERRIMVNDESWRCINVGREWEDSDTPDEEFGWWIEGVGSELGPLNTWLFGAMGNNSYFLGCSINGKKVFGMEDFRKYANRHLPLLEDGKRWKIRWAGAGLERYYIDEIVGDTIINDVSYRILDGAFLREDGSKVYIWDEDDGKETILYDIDLKEGDMFEDYVVLCVDTIVVHGISRKRIGLSNNYYIDIDRKNLGDEYDEKDPCHWLVCWVEGIGSQYSPSHYFDWQIAGPQCTMVRCVINDECVFTYDDFFAKPVSSISNPTSHKSASDTAVYDLQGRRVQTPQHGGLYIQCGKKFIFR